jgi:hypothetical protein
MVVGSCSYLSVHILLLAGRDFHRSKFSSSCASPQHRRNLSCAPAPVSWRLEAIMAKSGNKIYVVTGRNPNACAPSKSHYWNDTVVVVIAPTKAEAAEAFRGIYDCTSRHPVKVKPIGQFAFWDAALGKSLGAAYDTGNEGVNFGSGNSKTFVHGVDGVRDSTAFPATSRLPDNSNSRDDANEWVRADQSGKESERTTFLLEMSSILLPEK